MSKKYVAASLCRMFLNTFHLLVIYVYVHIHSHVCAHTGQRATRGNRLSPCTTWVPWLDSGHKVWQQAFPLSCLAGPKLALYFGSTMAYKLFFNTHLIIFSIFGFNIVSIIQFRNVQKQYYNKLSQDNKSTKDISNSLITVNYLDFISRLWFQEVAVDMEQPCENRTSQVERCSRGRQI